LARVGLGLALALLVVSGAIVAIAAVQDLRARDSSVETLARGYFAALERGDLDAALSAIQPAARGPAAAFVANLLGNEYRVQGVAVREPSVLDRLPGAPVGPLEVTVFVNVIEAASGARWQAGPTVPVVTEGGLPYLAKAPLS
jgi:hypothetical protein